ncbi:thiolase C-terminal domain-containing protein [Leptospira brenneri]|uniref:Thiolase family protein n=1 Tax=Leptospira brenneri TaxID=2023182 RepID=A0A2M9Y4M0_9LEPT|nr:acetyl-CoA acetyltransferase [Leptospira brenneri]PJZ46472.1 acetyl-CoA acetyltransferase [Leptospira brenneri]TGK96576.1 thiolase family protein [Leptospira brenneri]
MHPILLGVADTIESEFDSEVYKNLSPLEKYHSLLFRSVDKLFGYLGTDRAKMAPYLTDFVSIEAQSLGREGYGFTVKDSNDLGFGGLACHTVDLGGASVGGAIQQAHTIVKANPYAVVLVAAADVPKSVFKQVSDLKRLTATVCHKDWEMPYGATLIGLYSLLCERMMFDTGVTSEDLEEITKHFRGLAETNPRAFQYQKPLTEKQLKKPLSGVYSTPMIAIVTDHGFATLITSETMKQKLIENKIIKKDAEHIYLAGSGHSAHAEYFIQKKDLKSPAALACERAVASSGWKRSDIDYAWIYDCFTGMIIHEAGLYFGVSPKETATALRKGKISNGTKDIPINLGGGILNYQAAMALSGATGLIDIVSQYGLAVDPIPEKLENPPNVSLLGGNGGIDSINSVVIFSKEKPKSEAKEPLTLKPLEVNVPMPKVGEKATILTASTIYFNPGGEKKPPYLIVCSTKENGEMVLTNLFSKDGSEIVSKEGLVLGKSKIEFQEKDGKIQAILLE